MFLYLSYGAHGHLPWVLPDIIKDRVFLPRKLVQGKGRGTLGIEINDACLEAVLASPGCRGYGARRLAYASSHVYMGDDLKGVSETQMGKILPNCRRDDPVFIAAKGNEMLGVKKTSDFINGIAHKRSEFVNTDQVPEIVLN